MSSIYIHVPYCKKACIYCNFHFSTSLKLKSSLVLAMKKEIELKKDWLSNKLIQTIYLGGGTPSILSNEEFTILFESLNKNFDLSKIQEITVEANPDDLAMDKLQHWKSLGVNRLSLGIQSFKDQDLLFMNRAHDAATALRAVSLARQSGINNISVDLIYGIPNTTPQDLAYNLNTLAGLQVQHVSAYALTVEPKTAYLNLINRGKVSEMEESETVSQFYQISKFLRANGFDHYEISNFGKPGFKSMHNTNYWWGNEYLGIGPAAHSLIAGERWYNINNNAMYTHQIENNLPTAKMETLTQSNRLNEYLLTALRTQQGVNFDKVETLKPGYTAVLKNNLKTLDSKYFTLNLGSLALTLEGWSVSDYIISNLFEV